MKLLIGSDEKKLDSKIAKRFGDAAFYLVYDTTDKSYNASKNTQEDEDHSNLAQYIEKGVEVFIVGNVGPHAFEAINTSTTKVYLARKMTVQEAIDNFNEDNLQLLTEPTVKNSIGHGHQHGHGQGGHGRNRGN